MVGAATVLPPVPEIGHGPQEEVLGLGPDGRLGVLLEDSGQVRRDVDRVVGERRRLQVGHFVDHCIQVGIERAFPYPSLHPKLIARSS